MRGFSFTPWMTRVMIEHLIPTISTAVSSVVVIDKSVCATHTNIPIALLETRSAMA